jgi:hypothetical protein
MSDDAEVSEEVIRQMGNEIIRLREQLVSLKSPRRDEDSDRVEHPLCSTRTSN